LTTGDRLLATLRRWQAVNAALAMLPERERACVLAWLENEKPAETAKRLRVTKEMVRMRAEDGLKQLAFILYDEAPEG
jgi:DNA-directed RNA polymerase specialized sigma24 family protein